ncbi:hypothetical protein JJB09_16145 [Rhizobium sp. KVB221]|uniref:Uncharacterized protein n=1 Tax=Rhizobium setariae TaxID=2801340 RepID=A0A936YN87_9HYPH|nr:hypothetical protein [Rhizobium setariae]MBL0373558.1 hypothetical protein [Rhizobium setariae]
MVRKFNIRILAFATGLLSCTGVVLAQDAISTPGQKTIGATQTKMIPSLAVLNSGGATLANGKLTMTSMSANTIVFADRPVRAAGHVLTSDFIKQWDEGKDSFATDPPNATISVLNSDGKAIEDAVVVLNKPKLEGGTLTFDVEVLEGELTSANGPASLFIDWFAARGGMGRVGFVGGVRAPVWRGGWYAHPAAGYGAAVAAGAVIGAAARPYYPPACGYYPYPPCY